MSAVVVCGGLRIADRLITREKIAYKEKMDIIPTESSLLLYQTEEGQTKIEVRLQDETVWLSQAQLSALFEKAALSTSSDS